MVVEIDEDWCCCCIMNFGQVSVGVCGCAAEGWVYVGSGMRRGMRKDSDERKRRKGTILNETTEETRRKEQRGKATKLA